MLSYLSLRMVPEKLAGALLSDIALQALIPFDGVQTPLVKYE